MREWRLTKEQITAAKEIDLLTYLQQNEPEELKKIGTDEYCTVTHDSLKISKGLWNWFGHGIGGKNALDYLINVRKMEFTAAVEHLCSDTRSHIFHPVKKDTNGLFLVTPGLGKSFATKKPFNLPAKNEMTAGDEC